MKRLSFFGLVGFIVFAGLYHFINPQFYLPLIPDYIPFKGFVNVLSGIAEIILGVLLLSTRWRKLAGIGLILLMLAFIPAHIHFIRLGNCVPGGLCVPAWVGWARLLIVHPLLIYWIFSGSRYTS